MSIKFDSSNIDNNAIHLIIFDQLAPFLKYDSDSELRVLDLDNKNVLEKHLIFYEEIFVPYSTESHKHHMLHHGGGFYPDSWFGEQACLSMIHYLNQKAWWLLYYYSVKESVERHCDLSGEILNRISNRTTHCILDGNMSIADAVGYVLSSELNLEKYKEQLISNDITQIIEKYKDAPSSPMIYR